jgi:5-methyltetrahydropteroyltriglutamate--homocysteine methyltransferase
VEAYLGERKIKFQGANPKPMMLRVVGKLGSYRPHPMIEHFKFVKSHTKQTPKMTIPSPSSLHFRYGRSAVPESIYPDMADFYRDLGESYRKAVRAFATPAAAISSSTRSTSLIFAIRTAPAGHRARRRSESDAA